MNNVITLHSEKPNQEVTPTPHGYLQAATSNNTRKAYQADIRHFLESGRFLPATTDTILGYLQHYAPQLNSRTLTRRLTALKHWHTGSVATIFKNSQNHQADFCHI